MGLGGKVAVNMLDAIMYYMASDFQSYFVSGEPPRASGSRHPRAPMLALPDQKRVFGTGAGRAHRQGHREGVDDHRPQVQQCEEV